MARQKKILEKSIDVKVEDVVNDAEEIVEQTEEVVNEEDVKEEEVEQTEDVKDVEEDEVEELKLTERQLLCKWELNRLITIYGLNDFEKVVKNFLLK